MESSPPVARLWLRQQTALARAGAAPAIALGLADMALAITQAWIIAAAIMRGVDVGALAGFVVLALARAGLGVAAARAAFDAGAAARRRLRGDAMARLAEAGPAILRRHHSGVLASIVVDRIEAVDGLFGRWVPAAILAMAAPLLALAAVLWADPVAAAILAGAGLLVPVGMALSGLGAAAASRRQFAALSRLQARFLDRIRGISTIVLAGRAEDEAIAVGRAADELRRRTMRVLRVAFLSSAALDCAMAAALVLIALRYFAERGGGALRGADSLFVLLLVAEFFQPLRAFSAAYQDRMHALGAAAALAALPPRAAQAAGADIPPVRTVAARGVTVTFENVCLTWDPARGPALENLSFRVPAGETLLLVGPSGAGKSTILEILLGFVRPDSGRVTINGADLTAIVPQALANLTAWIGQKPVLFAGTIRDNVLFARPDATADELNEAVQFARLEAVAAALPQGLDTPIGEGGYGLSGGQAQRVAIARAFLKNAPLLLLDEPTAHLDPATEAEVLDSLRRLAIGRTVIMASHSVAAHGIGGRRLDLRDGKMAA